VWWDLITTFLKQITNESSSEKNVKRFRFDRIMSMSLGSRLLARPVCGNINSLFCRTCGGESSGQDNHCSPVDHNTLLFVKLKSSQLVVPANRRQAGSRACIEWRFGEWQFREILTEPH